MAIQASIRQDTALRWAEKVYERVLEDSREVAYQLRDEMESVVRDIAGDYPNRWPKVGRVQPSPHLPLVDSYEVEVIDEGDGWVVRIRPADAASFGKVAANEVGRGVQTVVARTAKKLSGWERDGKQVFTPVATNNGMDGRNIMRRARDRVYDNLRRSARR